MRKRSLMYLYVENLGPCFKNQDFNFSNKFTCSFIHDNKNNYKLIISKNENDAELYFENFNIDKINLIIGENGSGKTTILDSLGSTQHFRLGAIEETSYSNRYKWLAVYKVEDEEDTYIIEGYKIYDISNIKVTKKYNEKGDSKVNLKKVFFMKIKHSFDDKEFDFEEVEILNKDDEKKRVAFLYKKNYVKNKGDNIYIKESDPEIEENYLRKISQESSVLHMIDYIDNILEDNKNIFKRKNLQVVIEIADTKRFEMIGIYRKSSRYKELIEKIYGKTNINKIIADSSLLNTRDMIEINYLESVVLRLLHKEMIVFDSPKGLNYFENESVTSDQRISYLLSIIENKGNFNQHVLKNINETESQIKVSLVSIIESIKVVRRLMSKLSISNYNRKNRISVPILQKKQNRLEIMRYLKEINKLIDLNIKIEEWIPFSIRLSSVSSGELQYIKSFSNIYQSIKKINHDRMDSDLSCIILLDEPDMNFHPEWSRRYISTLNNMLEKFNPKKSNISFQFIITSHSPFLVSDIPKEFTIYINNIIEEKTELESRVINPQFGLMSNMYDLIKDSFFMEKPIGELANDFFKEIKNDIAKLKEYTDSTEREKLIILTNKKIQLVDDPIIKNLLENHLEKTIEELVELDDILLYKRRILVEKLRAIDSQINKKRD